MTTATQSLPSVTNSNSPLSSSSLSSSSSPSSATNPASYVFKGATFKPIKKHPMTVSLISEDKTSSLQKIDFYISKTCVFLSVSCASSESTQIIQFLKNRGISEIRHKNYSDDISDIDCRQFANIKKLYNVIKDNNTIPKSEAKTIETSINNHKGGFKKEPNKELPSLFSCINSTTSSFISTFVFWDKGTFCQINVIFAAKDQNDLLQLLKEKGVFIEKRYDLENDMKSIFCQDAENIQKLFNIVKDDAPIPPKEEKTIEKIIESYIPKPNSSEKKEEKKS